MMLRVWLIAFLLAAGGCTATGDGSPDGEHAVRGAYVGGSGGYVIH